jgi:hypothetical protein
MVSMSSIWNLGLMTCAGALPLAVALGEEAGVEAVGAAGAGIAVRVEQRDELVVRAVGVVDQVLADPGSADRERDLRGAVVRDLDLGDVGDALDVSGGVVEEHPRRPRSPPRPHCR